MGKDGIMGAAQKGVGSMKEAAGKATGDKNLEAKGMADRAAGAGKEAVGKAAVGKAKEAIHTASK